MASATQGSCIRCSWYFPQSVNIKIFNLWSGSNLSRHWGLIQRYQGVKQEEKKNNYPPNSTLASFFFFFSNCLKDLIKISKFKQELEGHRVA